MNNRTTYACARSTLHQERMQRACTVAVLRLRGASLSIVFNLSHFSSSARLRSRSRQTNARAYHPTGDTSHYPSSTSAYERDQVRSRAVPVSSTGAAVDRRTDNWSADQRKQYNRLSLPPSAQLSAVRRVMQSARQAGRTTFQRAHAYTSLRRFP